MGNNLIIGNAKLSLGIVDDYAHTWEGTVMCLELIRRSLAMILLRKPDLTEVLIIYSFLDGETNFTYEFNARCEGVMPQYVQTLRLISMCDINSLVIIDVSNED